MLAAPVAAQQSVTIPDAENLKYQVRSFEVQLRLAVERGGQNFQQRLNAVLPIPFDLVWASTPIVRGVPLPEQGFVFDVQIPDILQTPRVLSRGKSIAPPEVTTPPGGVKATSVEKDDPMTFSPVRRGPTAPFDPDQEYANLVRAALIDAMLDNSAALPITPAERLTVVGSVFDGMMSPSPVIGDSRKLILSIKGEDLLALRQGKLNREAAKERIVDRRF